MDAFLASTAAVAIAEIGDKTQLLSLFLVARSSYSGRPQIEVLLHHRDEVIEQRRELTSQG